LDFAQELTVKPVILRMKSGLSVAALPPSITMPTIKKILFPVDFSEACRATARYAEAFAGQFQSEVMLLHVVGRGEHTVPEELLPGRQAKLDAFLKDEFKYFDVGRLCVTGNDPAEVIAEAARRWEADLVMMPTHGLGTFRRFLLGSVTAKVLSDLDCPVWTDAHLESAPRLKEIHCRKILCAVDLGERSHSVLRWASWLSAEYQAPLKLVHAGLPSEDTMRRIDLLQKELGAKAEAMIVRGDPSQVAAQAARDFGADLLVIGRHGGAGEFLRQNAYAILCASPCPVVSI
jgi:nucleotide-binding universal stress UspA family protein